MSLKTAIEIKSKQPPKSFSGCICLSMFKAYGFNSFRSMLMVKKKALYKAISPRDLPCKVAVRMSYAKYLSRF